MCTPSGRGAFTPWAGMPVFESALPNGIPERIIFRAPIFIQLWHCEHVAVRDAVVYSSRAYAGARVALQLLTEMLFVVARHVAATGALVQVLVHACAADTLPSSPLYPLKLT